MAKQPLFCGAPGLVCASRQKNTLTLTPVSVGSIGMKTDLLEGILKQCFSGDCYLDVLGHGLLLQETIVSGLFMLSSASTTGHCVFIMFVFNGITQ